MLMSLVTEWTPEMDNIFEIQDEEYERHSRVIVKSLVGYFQNSQNGIDIKNIKPFDFDKINNFIIKMCQIGNLRTPKNNEDRYMIISHALFITDNGWDKFRQMMVARRQAK